MQKETVFDFSVVFEYQGGITSLTPSPTDLNTIYITIQKGLILEYNLVTHQYSTFLDLSEEISRVYEEKPMKVSFPDERGVLRLAFHPEYATFGSLFRGVFVVLFSEVEDESQYDEMSRIQIPEPDNMTCLTQFVNKGDPEKTKETRVNILCVPEPQANHNGGGLLFGKDGYLWLGLGDGGGANDEHSILLDPEDKASFLGNAQNLESYHGKILRLEVVQPMPQIINPLIPQDNPFVGNKYGKVWNVNICYCFICCFGDCGIIFGLVL